MAYIDDQHSQKANLDYIRNSMDEPLLQKDHELSLARRWRDDADEAALHELVKSYMRLVVSIATRFRNYGLPMGDLIQEGNIGLMQAAQRFDPDRDLRFSTYANWWIRSAIQDYVLRNWSIVRTGTTAAHKSLFFNLRRLRARIERENEREGLDEHDRKKIANELGINVKDIDHMEGRLYGGDQSLNAKLNDDSEEEWQSFMTDETPTPEEIVIGTKDGRARSQWLKEALAELPNREQKIIRKRHLQHGTVTLEELGKDLGISKERVRQLEQRAMEKLKSTLSETVGDVQDFLTEN